MSPERAARILATFGAVLLLALFALRGLSLSQTLNNAARSPQEQSMQGFSLGLFEYSPDGSQVSFQQKAPNQISRFYTLDFQTGAVTEGRLEQPSQETFSVMDEQIYLRIGEEYVRIQGSPTGIEVQEMAVSPSGSVAVYTGQRPGGPDGLYVLHSSGRLDWLGEEEWMSQLTWSPDEQTILYLAPRDGFDQIVRIGIDGAGQQQLTSDPTHKSLPVWSPDGARIAYVSAEIVPSPPPVEREMIGPTPTPTATLEPSVTPSPTPTVESTPGMPFASTFLGADIYLMEANGANPRRLTESTDYEHSIAWINGGSELAYAVSDTEMVERESVNINYLYAINPQTGNTRRVYPQFSLDSIQCPPSLPSGEERMLRLTLTNQGLQPLGVPVVLRSGPGPFSQQSIFEVDQRRTGAVRVETIDLQPGKTRTVEWPVAPMPGLVTYFSAIIDRPDAVLFSEQHCATQNTYLGLPILPFLPFALPLLATGMLLMVPWLLQQKKTLLWILWALIPLILAGLVLYEAQSAALDKIFMPF